VPKKLGYPAFLVGALTLLGLIGIQWYWVQMALQHHEHVLDEKVSKVLDETVDDAARISEKRILEELKHQGFTAELIGEGITSMLDVQEKLEIRDTVIRTLTGEKKHLLILRGLTRDSLTGMIAEHKIISGFPGLDITQDIDPDFDLDSLSIAIRLSNHLEEAVFTRSRMINEILLETFWEPMNLGQKKLINPSLIDSLLRSKLRRSNIESPYEFSLDYDSLEYAVLPSEVGAYRSSIETPQYRVDLFPNEVLPSYAQLHLNIEDRNKILWSGIRWALALSSILVLGVLVALGRLLGTVRRQKKLSVMKNDFINNMTHELKTPISTISLACEALEDADMVSSEGARSTYVGMIRNENKRLGRLVENVLRTSLIEKGELRLNKEDLNLNELIAEIVEGFRIQVESRGGNIKVNTQNGVYMVKGDRLHLSNVIYNLIDNANKYSPKNPEIDIEISEIERDTIQIAVTDQGMGIAREHKKRVFEKLYRVPKGNVHDVKGFGLGLNYVKSIVELHGGKVGLESEEEKGSTFWITIPRNG